MKNSLYILIISFILLGCSKNDVETTKNDYPECVATVIKTTMQNYSYNTKSTIEKYNYKGEVVYHIRISPGDPDYASEVVNEKCELICLIGGIDGNKNDCIDWDKATFIETVWKDPR